MPISVVAVAYSGGRDSTALLHATVAAAQAMGVRVAALHVHHGLCAEADAWQRRGHDLCRRWARAGRPVEFVAERLVGAPAKGESVEAWAREQRYLALRRMASACGADLVLLAHHRRDQAETFLLQALRGGGAAALSAMPRIARRGGVTWARPWLDAPRESIDAYLRKHRLRHSDDDSNDDARFARNRLRKHVWPALASAFPQAEASLAKSAARLQPASAALAEWAALDLPQVSDDEALHIVAWRSLPRFRRHAVLQAWLQRHLGRGVPGSLVDRLMTELGANGTRRWPTPTGELASHRGRLLHRRLPLGPGATAPIGACGAADLSVPGSHRIAGWQGSFEVERVASGGVTLQVAAALELRRRAGGERFQAGPGRPPRSLKLQYQAAGRPAWERVGPLAFHQGVLVFAPGLGIDARAVAAPGEAQVALVWRGEGADAGERMAASR